MNIEPSNLSLSTNIEEQKENYEILLDIVEKEIPVKECEKLSMNERYELNWCNPSFMYGEIKLKTIKEIFDIIKEKKWSLQNKGGIFYDLGSGSGKAVLSAGLLHDFDKCIGIEILECLYQKSLNVIKLLNEYPELQKAHEMIINFINQDIYKMDPIVLSDATLILLNSVSFDDHLLSAIELLLAKVKIGCLLIAVHKHIKSKYWLIKYQKRYAMSWGTATIIIQQRI